ncbi:PIN domain-containing protein [Pseudomonas oryzihabitans]|uniref:DUF4935 domain-containing protein n=1 Tax=Pseudomonas oryzihabitans TaxID=47885 RepID=A0AAJ2BL91_9PSED|nr:PIN domain-containing protein [Pseudomonas psychrotolerans]MDR6236461.1 hypothetical protein [Pseudomonas psychrotolerans]
MSIKPEYFEKLREMLISGAITAITFDTQAFDRNGRTFRAGLLAQLGQIKNSSIKLIVTELVRDEAEKHMLEMHSARHKKVDDAFALAAQYLSDDLVDEVREELQARATPAQIVFHEINDFFLATNAELAFYDEISTRNLFKLYFNNKPPFHRNNDKKHEFPDAVALLSLEAHAENGGILVVSSDKDWIEFCNSSENKRLHCIPDLTTALSLINSIEANVREITNQRFLQLQRFNDCGGLKAAISDNLTEKLERDLLFTARTKHLYNARCSSIKVDSVIQRENKIFGKIRDDSSRTIWALELDAACNITVDVDFFCENRNYIGSNSYHHTLSIPTISIIKLTRECIDVEVSFDIKTILDLGPIEPK